MSRLTRSMPSTWNRIWLRGADRTISTGSSVSAEDPDQLVERAGRDHDAGVLDRVQQRDRLDGDAVVVGRGEGQAIALEAGQDAGQDGPCLVAGGGERGLLEGLPQDLLRGPRRGPLAGRRDGREVVGVDALDVRLEAPGADPERGRALELEVDPLARRAAS